MKRVMQIEVDGTRRRGRPKKRWIDGVTKDMEEVMVKGKKWWTVGNGRGGSGQLTPA